MASTQTDHKSAATVPVGACQLRPGDMVALCDASDIYTPALSKVAVAEYSPVGGCIAFRIGLECEDGSTHFVPTIGWGGGFPGHYSWSDRFYATPEDAEVINARLDLFHEAYPAAA